MEILINTTAAAPNIGFDLLDPQVIEDPYPFYRALLEKAPVYQVPGTAVFLVSSWHLIHQVLRNQRDYSANLTGILVTGEGGQPELFDLRQFGGSVDAIANADEPSHSIHRKLVLPQLNARRVEAMEAEVRGWVRAGIAKLLAGAGGDCIGDLANAIPVMVMARLTGLPVEDLELQLQWAFAGGDILAGTSTLAHMAELGVATGELSAYLGKHFDKALGSQHGGEPANVLEELARGVEQGLVTEREAISILVVLVGAAGESTSSLVGSVIRLLAQDQELQQRLRRSPELIERCVEEVVRLESPFRGHYRAVLKDTQLGGVAVPEDSRVYLLWAAANRDPSVFDSPDTLDLQRPNANEHLGFGHGIHFCIGARLARMEARVIVEELLQCCGNFRLDERYPVEHVQSIFVRRLPHLHLRLES